MDWLKLRWAIVRRTIASGDVATFERRYLPAALFVGAVVGACLCLLSMAIGVVIVLIAGFGLGYAARAYVSYRRRMDYLRHRADRL